MRKYHKEQCLELIDSIIKAQDECVKHIERENIELAAQLLGDCQQAAISVGTMIEQVESEGTEVVRQLEDYCDILYCLYERIVSGNIANVRKEQKLLVKKLQKASNYIRNDFHTEYEVVFLPYKASMWDSLESVWEAADNDPDCHAYVVPIPYYDKTPNGTVKEGHYELEQFPEHVPVVHYNAYKIEQRRPDIIFAHSPYDNYNYVTSVHSDFYCEKLKDFTGLLVYIPYFVNLDNVPEHFCVCAGTIYADMVAVQSERVKATYIQAFKKFEKERNCQNRFGNPRQKFMALGSPKIDAAIATAKEKYAIPKSWKEQITNKEGERKKIVLLNTTLAYILKFENRYIDHLREVFNIFRTYDDVLLLWRPHPLSDATFSSMRQELYKEYLQLIDYYKTNKIGIYDDTPNPYQAISLCDACYGDNSSMLVLVWAAHKPILYRNTIKTFRVINPENGDFMDAVYRDKNSIKKMLFYENYKYSLKHFLFDIQSVGKFGLINQFIESDVRKTCLDNFTNFGRAGEEIYKAAKIRLLGGK